MLALRELALLDWDKNLKFLIITIKNTKKSYNNIFNK